MKINIETKKQFITFIFVGIINTLFGYSIFAFFIFVKISYYFAFLLAGLLGTMLNFISTGRIVFKNKDFNLFYKFLLVSTVLYFLNIILVKTFNVYINNFYISGLMTMGFTAILAFSLNKKVFSIKNTVDYVGKCLDEPS